MSVRIFPTRYEQYRQRLLIGAGALCVVVVVLTITIIAASSGDSGEPTTGPSASVSEFLEREWAYVLETSPELASYVGVHTYDTEVTDLSLDAFAARAQHARDALDELRAIDDGSADASMYAALLEHEIASFDNNLHLLAISQLDGVHQEWSQLQQKTSVDAWPARDAKLDTVVNQTILLLQKSVELGVVGACAPLIEGDLVGQLDSVLAASNRAAWKRLRDFVRDKYVPKCRANPSITAIPNGDVIYRRVLVPYYTTNGSASAEAIHATGVAEVARIRGEMEALRLKMASDNATKAVVASAPSDFVAFNDWIRANTTVLPGQHVATTDEILRYVRDVVMRSYAETVQLFRRFPSCPLKVSPVPAEFAASAPQAYYMDPDAQCTRPGEYFVNTYDAASVDLFELFSTTIHEAIPGHHFQLAIQQELTTLASFRKAGVASVGAFVEGWALYSESLGREMGLYADNPFVDYAAYGNEMHRAVRLVVDVGMHLLNMTVDEATAYMLANEPIEPHAARVEILRYVTWPGQALSYKYGAMKIQELRARVVPDQMDVKEFHDKVLGSGAVSLSVLESFFTST